MGCLENVIGDVAALFQHRQIQQCLVYGILGFSCLSLLRRFSADAYRPRFLQYRKAQPCRHPEWRAWLVASWRIASRL